MAPAVGGLPGEDAATAGVVGLISGGRGRAAFGVVMVLAVADGCEKSWDMLIPAKRSCAAFERGVSRKSVQGINMYQYENRQKNRFGCVSVGGGMSIKYVLMPGTADIRNKPPTARR